LRRNIPATNWKELGLIIDEVLAEYFNVLLGKARNKNKVESKQE
jgi:hypothetical protein